MSKPKKHQPKKSRTLPAAQPKAQPLWLDRIELWLEANGKWWFLFGWMGFLILYCSLATDELGAVLGGDNARYLMLAQSLAQGKGYRDLMFFGEPAHTQYPFLFPLLISPLARLGRQAFYTHLFLQIVASVIPLLLAAWARLEGQTRLKSLLLFFLAGSIPAYFAFLLNILTEILFMFFMFSALFLISFAKARGFDPFKIILISLAVLASALTREAGLVLFVALTAGIFLDPKLRKIKLSPLPLWIVLPLIFILGYGAWTARNLSTGEGGIYFKQFLAKDPYHPDLGSATIADLIQRIQENKYLHVPHLGGFAFPAWLFNSPAAAFRFSLPFFAVILLGWGSRVWQKHFYAELSFAALFGLALIWFYKEERFSFALLPLAVYYFVEGLGLIEKILPPLKTVFLGLLAALLLWQIGLTGWLESKYHHPLIYPVAPVEIEGYGTWTKPALDFSKYNQYWQSPEESNIALSDWIVIQKVAGEILPPDAVIISRKASITWYYSGRKSDWYKMGVTPEAEWKYLQTRHATHLLVSGSNQELVQLLNAYPNNFQMLAVIRRSGLALVKIVSFP